MEGENKEQKEKTHHQIFKKNPQTSGQVKSVGKFSHVPNPPCDKRHVKKGEGKYSRK
jgi:hypothetical protein